LLSALTIRDRIRAFRPIAEAGQPIAEPMLAASGEVMASE